MIFLILPTLQYMQKSYKRRVRSLCVLQGWTSSFLCFPVMDVITNRIRTSLKVTVFSSRIGIKDSNAVKLVKIWVHCMLHSLACSPSDLNLILTWIFIMNFHFAHYFYWSNLHPKIKNTNVIHKVFLCNNE